MTARVEIYANSDENNKVRAFYVEGDSPPYGVVIHRGQHLADSVLSMTEDEAKAVAETLSFVVNSPKRIKITVGGA